MLLLRREHQYENTTRNEWSSEIVVNVSDFNGLSGMDLSVPDDGRCSLSDTDLLYCHYFLCIGNYDNGIKNCGKQIGLIYFFPVICGCVTASFRRNWLFRHPG